MFERAVLIEAFFNLVSVSWQDASLGSRLPVNSERFIPSPKSTCVITQCNALPHMFQLFKNCISHLFPSLPTQEDAQKWGDVFQTFLSSWREWMRNTVARVAHMQAVVERDVWGAGAKKKCAYICSDVDTNPGQIMIYYYLNSKHFSTLSKPSAYITHNETCPLMLCRVTIVEMTIAP